MESRVDGYAFAASADSGDDDLPGTQRRDVQSPRSIVIEMRPSGR